MKNSATLLTLVASAWSSMASPIERRELGGILMCTGADASGTCNYTVYALDQCHNVSEPLLMNTVTFAPDGEEFYCNPYGTPCGVGTCTSPTGCTVGNINFEYEHKYNLTEVGWDKSVASFQCQKGKGSPWHK